MAHQVHGFRDMPLLTRMVVPLALVFVAVPTLSDASPREMKELADKVLQSDEVKQREQAGRKEWGDIRKALRGVSSWKVRKAIDAKTGSVVIGQRLVAQQGTRIVAEQLLVTRKGLVVRQVQKRDSVGFSPQPVLEGVEIKPATLGFAVGKYTFKLGKQKQLITREDWQNSLKPAEIESAVGKALGQK